MSEQLRYSQRVRMYKEGYVSVCVYKSVTHSGRVFHDTVIYRKVRNGNGKNEFQRGTNLKPEDLPILWRLLQEAHAFLETQIQ